MTVLEQIAGQSTEVSGTKTTLVEVIFPPDYPVVAAKAALAAHAVWVKRGMPKWNSAVQLPLIGEAYPSWDKTGGATFLRKA